MDVIDRRILAILAHNSRTSLRRMAEELGMPHTTIHSRLKKLEAAGVIRRYTVDIDYSVLGYDVTALINVSVEGSLIEDVERRVSEISNVIAVYDVTGEFDIVLVARFRGIGELDRFIKWLNKLPGVRRTLTSIAFRVVKEDPVSLLEA